MTEKQAGESKGSFWIQGWDNVNSQWEPAAIRRANKQRREDEKQCFAHSSCPDYSGSASCVERYVMNIFIPCWLIVIHLLNETEQK